MNLILEAVEKAIKCVEESPTIPIPEYTIDVFSRAILKHKILTLAATSNQIPEHLRQTYYMYTVPNIKPILPHTHLTQECIDIIKTLASTAILLAQRTSERTAIVLYKIGSLLSRTITRYGIAISKDNLIGILHELQVYLVTAISEVHTTGVPE